MLIMGYCYLRLNCFCYGYNFSSSFDSTEQPCILAAVIILVIAEFEIYGNLYGANIHTVWSLGFGTTQPETFIHHLYMFNMLPLVLISNTPQLILTFLYYISNKLLTCMLSAAEYSSYSVRRKPLRVSGPEGAQRSTYFLSLPYRYSVPAMIISAVLHWLLSRSVFYVRILQYDQFGVLDSLNTMSTIDLSALPMIFVISLAGIALLILLGLGLKRFPTQMPLAGNCSLAISAACHPPFGDKNAALKPVLWGEVQLESSSSVDEEEDKNLVRVNVWGQDSAIHHYSFTSMEVWEPSPHQPYV